LDLNVIENDSIINIISFGNILSDLNMIDEAKPNEALIFEAWKHITPEDNSEISEREMWKFCLAVYNSVEGDKNAKKGFYKKFGLTKATI
jgi:hypothetical protein